MKNFLLLLVCLLSLNMFSQKKFDKLWDKIEILETKNHSKDAYDLVLEVYDKAKRKNNQKQIAKAFIYKSKFELMLKENSENDVYQAFLKEIETQKFPFKQILTSHLAESLNEYYTSNYYKIRRRSETNTSSEDFTTWSENKLYHQIDSLYQESLNPASKLQKIKDEDYKDFLKIGDNYQKFRTSIYDLLAHRYIEFLEQYRQPTEFKSAFKPEDSIFLTTPKAFIKLNIDTEQSTVSIFKQLKIYQNLETFHWQNNSELSVFSLALERLEFLKNNGDFGDKTVELYIKSLQSLKNEFDEDYSKASILLKLAEYHEQFADKENYPDFYKKSVKLAEECIEIYPESQLADQAKKLIKKIQFPNLEITSQEIISPNQMSKVLVNFKNMDSLDLEIYKLSAKNSFFDEISSKYDYKQRESIIKSFFESNTAEISKTYKLPNQNNHFNYSTEVLIPELEKGQYVLKFSEKSSSDVNYDEFKYQIVKVSDLAFQVLKKDDFIDFQLVERLNGKPIENAQIHLEFTEEHNEKSFVKPTDKNGIARFNFDESYQAYQVTFIHNEDTLSTKGSYSKPYRRQASNSDEDLQIFAQSITDRSIYRPGQDVFFKTFVHSIEHNQTSAVENFSVQVFLLDHNRETLDSLQLKTNEFGSVHGKFKIPRGRNLGQYYIKIDEDFDNNESFYDKYDYFDFEAKTANFNVEEYKRPKFEVDINDLKTTHTLNDSINISGKAQAFFGGNVSNAKVEFTVERRMNYNPLYRQTRYFEPVEPERIAAGEVETDQDGNFEIAFKAEPDETVDKKFLPIFVYKIKASVTDINGETRTAENTINIGYHGLNINIFTENEITEGENQKVQITANDLNANKKAIQDTLKVYRFKSLNRKLKHRPWSPPEIQQIPYEQFVELFPHEAYDQNELKKLNEIDTLVTQIIVDTDKKNIFNYDEKLNLESGKYQLKINTKDEFGNEIKAEQNINYTSKVDAKLPQETFTLEAKSLENSNGKFAQLNMQSDADELYIFLEISNQSGFYERRFYSVKTRGSEQIKLPENTQKAQIQWSYVYDNQWQSNSKNIDFKTKNGSIQVEVISHRNKLEPGNDETWSLKVTDDTKNPVAAEVVASMYDASLDDFKPHEWRVKFEKDDYNPYKSFGNSDIYSRVFSISSFTTLNRSYFSYRSLTSPALVKLENFGYHFTKPFEAQNEYVKKLIAKLKTKIKFKNGTVSGYVYDEDGVPVPGANIIIKGTNRGTQTDFDGYYKIKAKNGDQLVAKYLGFESQTATVNTKGIDFTLKLDSESLDEVVVTGYDDESSFAMKGAVSGIQVEDAEASPASNSFTNIRGRSSINEGNYPLYVVDGEIVSAENFRNLNPKNIAEVSILKGEEATSLYGSRGKNGVVVVNTKSGDAELEAALKQIKPRKDLKETAFFLPQLSTDKNGEVIFNFESPEALTKWKFQALAHDKKMRSHRTELNVVTQKKLNISPNFPRFFRSGDRIFISAKITNLTDGALNGMAQLSFTDEINQNDLKIIHSDENQRINIPAKGSKNVSFELKIPENIEAIRYKIIAKAGQFTDGQEDVIPVLSNKVLITETLPIWVEPNSKTDFSFLALENNDSETLVHKSLTFNYNMNPIWTALEALPYTMDFPHECSEQTFAKLYSNLLSVKILNTHPDVQNILKQWRDSENETSAMFENEELKQILIEETPWLQEAMDDDAQRKQLGKLLDKDKNEQNIQELLSKLNAMQLPNGAFPWFYGGYKNLLISQHILAGFGHLEELEAFDIENSAAENMVKKLVMFLDQAYQSDDNEKTNYQKLHYLYSRSFFKTYNKPTITKLATEFIDAHQDDWISFDFSEKLLFALITNRFGYENLAEKVLEALEQNAVIETDKGMYWKENFTNYNWQNSAIENQALAVEAFREILADQQKTNLLKQWLIHSKRKAAWPTTKATTEAVYALMLSGKSWTTSEQIPSIKLGDISIEISEEEQESKRIKKVFSAEEIQSEMANIEIKNKSDSPQFGGMFWQYLENLDNVKSSSSEYLQVEKEWFVVKQTSDGENLIPLQNENLKIGDLVRIQLSIKAKDDFNFIHLKDLRASTFEPTNVISEYKYKDGLRFYQVTKDASTNFFIDDLPRGTYIIEYDLRVNQNGDFTGGHSNLQSMYAPEFSAKTKGGRILVK